MQFIYFYLEYDLLRLMNSSLPYVMRYKSEQDLSDKDKFNSVLPVIHLFFRDCTTATLATISAALEVVV